MGTRKGSMTRLRFGRNELSFAFEDGCPRITWIRLGIGQFEQFGDDEDLAGVGPGFGPEFGPGNPLIALSANVQVRSDLMIKALVGHDRACSVPSSLPAVHLGDQVRVVRNASEYALYTVVKKRPFDSPKTVRMGITARQRVGTSNEFAGILRIPVVANNLTDAQAQAASEMIERLVDDGSYSGLVVVAPHGGSIEFNTDREAEAVTLALGCSSWICKGWKAGGGTYARWHITSTEISPNSFPGLGQIADRGFQYAVSFHGMSGGGVLIGGRAPMALKMTLRAAILDALTDNSIEVTIAGANDANSGISAKNLVNWLTASGNDGVQIEQSPKVRQSHWQEVADAVIGVYSQLI